MSTKIHFLGKKMIFGGYAQFSNIAKLHKPQKKHSKPHTNLVKMVVSVVYQLLDIKIKEITTFMSTKIHFFGKKKIFL